MKLEHLHIQNFRGIRDLEIDFTDDLDRVRNLTLIVGPNGSGKTSILDAIWFGLRGNSSGDKQRKSFREGPEYVVTSGKNFAQADYRISISDEELKLMQKWGKELAKLWHESSFILDSKTASLGWTYPAQTGYREVLTLKAKKEIFVGYKRKGNGADWNIVQGRKYADELQKSTAQPLADLDKVGGIYLFEDERQIIANPVANYKPFSEEDEAIDDLRFMLIDLGIKDKLGRVSEQDSWYQIVKDSYNYICAPHTMGEVYATSSGGEYEIEFKDADGKSYGFDGLSSGERSVLNFMVQYVYKRMTNSIVLIDELELHLHPTWQRRLMQNLLRLDDGNQFIITTHSPALMMSASPESIIELGKLEEQIPAWQNAQDEEG